MTPYCYTIESMSLPCKSADQEYMPYMNCRNFGGFNGILTIKGSKHVYDDITDHLPQKPSVFNNFMYKIPRVQNKEFFASYFPALKGSV